MPTANKRALRAAADRKREKAAQRNVQPKGVEPKPVKGSRSMGARARKQSAAQIAEAERAKGGEWTFVTAGKSPVIHVIGEGDGYGRCDVIDRARRKFSVDEWSAVEPGAPTCEECKTLTLAKHLTAGRKQPVAVPDPQAGPSVPAKRSRSTSGQPTAARGATTADRGQAKADDLAAYARDAGWEVAVELPAATSIVIQASRADEELVVTFTDGKLDETSGHWPVWKVAGREVRLRNVSQAKKQLASDGEDRPVSREAKPRRNGSHDDSPDYADLGKLSDEEVLESVKGNVIMWRNSVSRVLTEALVPSKVSDKLMKIEFSPVNGDRLLTFFSVIRHARSDGEIVELPVGWRSVRVDKILRVDVRSSSKLEREHYGDDES